MAVNELPVTLPVERPKVHLAAHELPGNLPADRQKHDSILQS